MSSRYIRQSEVINTVYSPDCLIAVEKGAVLLDVQTNSYLLQLKLSNIGKTSIVSTRIRIEAFDSSGKPAYPSFFNEYHYLVSPGDAFGTKKLIPLPNNNAVTFAVYIEEISTVSGTTISYSREQYIRSGEMPDMTRAREVAFQLEQDRRRQDIIYRNVWRANWYHVIFALVTLITLFVQIGPFLRGFHDPVIILFRMFVVLPISVLLWILAWVSIGSPKILKRSAGAASIISVLSACLLIYQNIKGIRRFYSYYWHRMPLSDFFNMFIINFLPFLIMFIINFLPFLIIFINARRHDKTLKLKTALMFWQPAQKSGIQDEDIQPVVSLSKEHGTSNCPYCQESVEENSKFCIKCGGSIGEKQYNKAIVRGSID